MAKLWRSLAAIFLVIMLVKLYPVEAINCDELAPLRPTFGGVLGAAPSGCWYNEQSKADARCEQSNCYRKWKYSERLFLFYYCYCCQCWGWRLSLKNNIWNKFHASNGLKINDEDEKIVLFVSYCFTAFRHGNALLIVYFIHETKSLRIRGTGSRLGREGRRIKSGQSEVCLRGVPRGAFRIILSSSNFNFRQLT